MSFWIWGKKEGEEEEVRISVQSLKRLLLSQHRILFPKQLPTISAGKDGRL